WLSSHPSYLVFPSGEKLRFFGRELLLGQHARVAQLSELLELVDHFVGEEPERGLAVARGPLVRAPLGGRALALRHAPGHGLGRPGDQRRTRQRSPQSPRPSPCSPHAPSDPQLGAGARPVKRPSSVEASRAWGI